MNTVVVFAALAMLAMVNAAPLQEDQKNDLQSMLDSLSDQTEAKESEADMQQVDNDDGSKAEAQFRRKLRKIAKGVRKVAKVISFFSRLYQMQAKEQQAKAQFIRLWANKQDVGDDDGSQAIAQFIRLWANKQDVGDDDGSLAKDQFIRFWANKQDVGDDDGSQAIAQFIRIWANKQDVGDDDGSPAEAQFFKHIARFLFG